MQPTTDQAIAALNGMAPAGYAPPFVAPTVAQQAAVLLAGGIMITSTSTPALNGVYAIDATAQANINIGLVLIHATGWAPRPT